MSSGAQSCCAVGGRCRQSRRTTPSPRTCTAMSLGDWKNRLRQNRWLRSVARGLWRLSREIPRRIKIQSVPFLQRWSGRPVGFHRTVGEYLAKHPGRGWDKCILPGGSYERARPIGCGGPLPACFDPPQTVAWEDERVIFLEGCRYWGEYGGSIIAHDEHLIGELSRDVWGTEMHAIFNRLKLPNLKPLPGLTAVISTPEANTNYGHWMMELMPRLEVLRRAGYEPSRIERYLINLSGSPHERESLTRAGILWDKVVAVNAQSHFRCEQIVTVNLRTNHFQFSLPWWVPSYLRSLFLSDPAPGGEGRFYITRKDCAFRRVLNEEELYPLLGEYGFEIINPAGLSVQEQARLFASAEAVISPTGAAMTNLVFCAPGTRVMEIFSRDFFDVSSWSEATVARCRYHALIGERDSSDVPADTVIGARRQNLVVPVSALRIALTHFFTLDG